MAYVASWISLDNDSLYMSLTPETKQLTVTNGNNGVKIQGHRGKCPTSQLSCSYTNIYEVSMVDFEIVLYQHCICTSQ